MSRKKQPRAGIIPFYKENGQTFMLFMKPSNPEYGGDSFQIAKGRVDGEETFLVAAVREGGEELGLFKGNIIKTYDIGTHLGYTRWFLAEIRDKTLFCDPHFETKETKWLTPEEFFLVGRDIHKPVIKACVRYIKKYVE